MTEFTVEVTVDARASLKQDVLERLAELGGAASGTPGERRYAATMTVKAASAPEAGELALNSALAIAPGKVAALEVLTTAEADRRLAEPAFPRLAGVSEVAEELGITKQRLAVLRARADFPAPIATLSSGPVWRRDDLSTFAGGWQRRPGRPRKIAEHNSDDERRLDRIE